VKTVKHALAQETSFQPTTTVTHQPEQAAAPPAASPPLASAMPADVEQMILTHIGYPRQARRKGWQGRATFNLAVYEQKLAKLDLFSSSGHSLLDRAAMRGIKGIDHLPLANGTYRLPVEFRLQ